MSWERYLAWTLPISAVLGVIAGNVKHSTGVGLAVAGIAALIFVVIKICDIGDLIEAVIDSIFD